MVKCVLRLSGGRLVSFFPSFPPPVLPLIIIFLIPHSSFLTLQHEWIIPRLPSQVPRSSPEDRSMGIATGQPRAGAPWGTTGSLGAGGAD
ncbi:hypothetical protein BO70DRAFT_366434, partial [Aspergillus heteromorphus CBS 117.55]